MLDDVPPGDSKSKRKRQMIALQEIGEVLVELPAAQLSQVPLDGVLLQAIIDARSLTSHGARRRQLQYIGRLMRSVEDIAPIQAALDKGGVDNVSIQVVSAPENLNELTEESFSPNSKTKFLAIPIVSIIVVFFYFFLTK